MTKCPNCGCILEIKNNSLNGDSFIGCSNYPNCTYTRNLKATTDSDVNYSTTTSNRKCARCGCLLSSDERIWCSFCDD